MNFAKILLIFATLGILKLLLAEYIPYRARNTADTTEDASRCRCEEEEHFDVSLRSGQFKSPGFPTTYCDRLNCKWTIEAEEGTFISAQLDFFETENKYDVLEVYQTLKNGTTLLKVKQASLSGEYVPGSMERHFFSSLGGGLQFRFVTDNTDHNHPGFQISFQRHDEMATQEVQSLPPLPSNFRMDSSCVFLINSSSTEAIKLTVNNFTASVLTMKVFESENFQASSLPFVSELARIQILSPTLPYIVNSRTNSLTMRLSTTSLFNRFGGLRAYWGSVGGGDSLYDIQFQETASVCKCFPPNISISRTAPTSVLSPGFPGEYCDNHNCTARIFMGGPPLSPRQQRKRNFVEFLRVRFEEFRTEDAVDFVTLKALQRDGAVPLVSLSGDARALRQFSFDSTQFGLDFVTDHSIVESGFNLTVEAYNKPRECLCPGTPVIKMEGMKRTRSTAFDARKCIAMDCFWNIVPPRETIHRLLLTINHTLADPTEFIDACQGPFHERNPSCVRFDSSTERFNVEFETIPSMFNRDISKPMQPITIWYHREWPDNREMALPNRQRQITISYEWREACQCGRFVYMATAEMWQPMRSPDYPQSYCRSMRCRWRIDGPARHHLLLNITYFATEAEQDFLTIFDGNDTTQRHIAMLSGIKVFGAPLQGKQRQMSLMFTSDHSIQMKGFEIWFKAVPNADLLAEIAAKKEQKIEEEERSKSYKVLAIFLLLGFCGFLFFIARSNSANIRWPAAMRPPAWIWPSGNVAGFVGRVHFARNLLGRGAGENGDDEHQALDYSIPNPNFR